MVIMPHRIIISPVRETPAAVVPTLYSVSVVARTKNIYHDTCRLDLAYTIYPNLALGAIGVKTVRSNTRVSNCDGDFDVIQGIGSCRLIGEQCRNIMGYDEVGGDAIRSKQLSVLIGTAAITTVNVTVYPPPATETSAADGFMRATTPMSPMMHTDVFLMQVFILFLVFSAF
jgi:hypothetical protein